MRTKPSARRKLIGWGVFAAGIVVIIGIFLISRGPSPVGPAAVTADAGSSAVARPSAAAEPSDASEASSQAAESSVPVASSSAASVAPPPPPPPSSPIVLEPDTMDQGTRKALLSTLIEQGIFTGVEAIGSPPKVGVTPLFQGLNPGLQQQFLATVYSYVNNGGAGKEALQVVDAETGTLMGNFTPAGGLQPL